MTIRRVLRAGHPLVRQQAETYPEDRIGTEPFKRLVDDMFATMRDYDGVGLAAPQVQQPYRLLVYGLADSDRYEKQDEIIEPTVLVNPTIVQTSDETKTDWEGCLSLPELRGKVPRSESVTVEAINRTGETMTCRADGFEARIIQHELDHLRGSLFLDQMNDMRTLSFLDEYHQFHAESLEPDGSN